MNNQSEDRPASTGAPINFSQASRTATITTEKQLVYANDPYIVPAKKKSSIGLVIGILFLTSAARAFVKGFTWFGIIAAVISLIGFGIFLVFRGIATGAVYESGLLIPAIITNIESLEIVTLADIRTSEVGASQYACKRLSLDILPLHNHVINEKVPCVALFGGSRDGLYLNFEPRPLAWATSSPLEIQENIAHINQDEWDFLVLVAHNVPKLEKDEIALFDAKGDFLEIR